MTAIELRELLIHRIAEINDKSILNTLKNVLDSKNEIILLTNQQQEEILESKKNIENGLFFEQSQLDNEFNKWAST